MQAAGKELPTGVNFALRGACDDLGGRTGAESVTYHGVRTPNDLKGIVHALPSHLREHLLDGLLEVSRVDAVGGSQLLGLGKLVLVDVHGNDAGSSSCLAAHDNREANSSKAEDGTGGAWFYLHSMGPCESQQEEEEQEEEEEEKVSFARIDEVVRVAVGC